MRVFLKTYDTYHCGKPLNPLVLKSHDHCLSRVNHQHYLWGFPGFHYSSGGFSVHVRSGCSLVRPGQVNSLGKTQWLLGLTILQHYQAVAAISRWFMATPTEKNHTQLTCSTVGDLPFNRVVYWSNIRPRRPFALPSKRICRKPASLRLHRFSSRSVSPGSAVATPDTASIHNEHGFTGYTIEIWTIHEPCMNHMWTIYDPYNPRWPMVINGKMVINRSIRISTSTTNPYVMTPWVLIMASSAWWGRTRFTRLLSLVWLMKTIGKLSHI